MDDVCIVCSRTIDWPEEELLAAAHQGEAGPSGSASASGSHARRSTNGASSEDGASQSSGMHRTTSSDGKHTAARGAAAAAAAGKAGRPVKHAHTVRIRKNHSTGRLAAKGGHAKHAAGLRPLTSAQATVPPPAEASSSAPASEDGEADATDEVTASNLPDWMAIYCSEECRKEDELRSRLSFANLNDERVKFSPSSLPAQQHFSSAAASIARNRSSGNLHQPQQYSPFAPQHRFPSGLPSSPLANDSEGSEFEWSTGRNSSARNRPTHARHQQHQQQQQPTQQQQQHSVSPRRQSSHVDRISLDSRRYSDGSDSSRLSVAVDAHRARRSTSRTRDSRGSTDSLASAMSLGDGNSYSYDPSTSSYYQHQQQQQHAGSSASSSGTAFPRPDLTHRSTSALSSGLRAMTPIHASSSSGSPRDRSPPVRPTAYAPSSSSYGGLPATGRRSSSPANGIMIRSNSSLSNLSNDDHSHAGHTAASSTFIPSSSRSTFRPASLGKGGLKPSKSSATLALSGISDLRGTIGSGHDRYEEQNAAGATSSSYTSPESRFHADNQRPRKPSHRAHASNSSIPYLSCSPSSPGSGSIASARSTASTAPSSSSARGEPEDGDPHHLHTHAARPSRKSAYVDERERTASLQTYGLFHQRIPSTPSLTALAQQATYGSGAASYGRSPPAQRHMRLSSSYDTTASGGTITKAMRDRHAARTGAGVGDGENGAASPRRSTFDINAHGHGHELFLRPHMRHASSGGATATATAESTPTQSAATTRSPSFAEPGPAHEVVHLSTDRGGDNSRPRAPSITRTDLERIPSHTHTQSTTSDGSGSAASPPSPGHSRYMPQYGYPAKFQRQPSHPAIHQLQSEDYALANARPAHPSQPGRGSYTSAPPPIASRSSFSWDHLPSYVPTYTAMDIDKVRRNKSGASLHSVYEDRDDYDAGSAKLASQQQQHPLQYSRPVQPAQHKKRLFYFPDDV